MPFQEGATYIKCPCTDCECVLHIWAKVPNHVCESCAAFEHEYRLRTAEEVEAACKKVASEGMYYVGNFLAGYIEALFELEPENDEGEKDSGELGMHDIAPEAWSEILGDIARFERENEDELEAWYGAGGSYHAAGVNLFLDRNGHGAGFGDEEYPGSKALANAARAFGESNVYKGDDERLYVG